MFSEHKKQMKAIPAAAEILNGQVFTARGNSACPSENGDEEKIKTSGRNLLSCLQSHGHHNDITS